MVPFLESEHRDQLEGKSPMRCARVEVVLENQTEDNELFELLVDLDNNRVNSKQHHRGKHSYIDSNYMKKVEAACLADADVQEEIRRLELPDSATVVVEPWAYATDGMNDMSRRITMVCFLYYFRCIWITTYHLF